MSLGKRFILVLPPLVVGASLAGAVEMSAGLLLYSAEGFLPALTLILTVEAGALALGLWSGSLGALPVTVETLRRRWLFALMTFAVAAAFSTGLTFMGEMFAGGAGQGFGLALLGSLPLFALGSLLSGMATPGESAVRGVGVPALAGVAMGFLLTGGILLPHMAPYTLYLSCLTVLSGGALLHGRALDARFRRQLLAEEWTTRGRVRVEEWVGPGTGDGLRVVTEGGRVRGSESTIGGLGRGWERAVLSALEQQDTHPSRVLYLGGGSGSLLGHLMDTRSRPELVVVEGTQEFVSLCRLHLQPVERWEEVQIRYGEPWPSLDGIQGSFDLVLVDLAFLPSLGFIPHLSEARFGDLAAKVTREGIVVLGGLASPDLLGELPLARLLKKAATRFARVVHYQGEEEGFLLLSGSEAPVWSTVPAGFRLPVSKEA